MIEWLCDENELCHAVISCETACGHHVHPMEQTENPVACPDCVTALDTMVATVPA